MDKPTIKRRDFIKATAAGIAMTPLTSLAADRAVDADVLLKGGTLYDGTGKPARQGDVAIRGERIVAVGSLKAGKVGRVIDCTGLVVTPGFIDLHTHSDRSITKGKCRVNLNYLTQGCTTVITGNCGLAPADTGKYFKDLDCNGAGTNIIHLIGHGPVRKQGMKNAKRSAKPDELARMKNIVDKDMGRGTWGLSTGLIYNWSCYGDTDELVELSKVVARHGGLYVSHIRGEADNLCKAVGEAIEIGRRAKLPAHVSHFKSAGVPNWGRLRDAADLIEAARRSGQVVTADQYPYVASSTSIAATLMPESQLPGGRANILKRMEKDADLRQKTRELITRQIARSKAVMIDSCKMANYKGRKLREIAKAEKIDVVDLVLKIHAAGGASVVNFSMSEEDVRHGMARPFVATASDGWARLPSRTQSFHPRNFGTFPRKIGHYAGREKVISMEHAVRSCTGLPADILGLTDRGYLRENTYADVLVFDPEKFIDRATFDDPDLYCKGVCHLFIAGQIALEGTTPSKKDLHGRLIRHKSKA